MGVLSDQWRNRAKELNEALPALLKHHSVSLETVQAIKAAVLPEMLLGMADMLQVLEATPQQNAATRRLAAINQRHEQVRLAAVRALNEENWDEFDRLAASAGVADS